MEKIHLNQFCLCENKTIVVTLVSCSFLGQMFLLLIFYVVVTIIIFYERILKKKKICWEKMEENGNTNWDTGNVTFVNCFLFFFFFFFCLLKYVIGWILIQINNCFSWALDSYSLWCVDRPCEINFVWI